MAPKVVSLMSIVVQLGWMIYFILGSALMAILKYDEPNDARIVRNFFNVHYVALVGIAVIGALSGTLSGRVLIAGTAVLVCLYAVFAKLTIVGAMDRLLLITTLMNSAEIATFRRCYAAGLAAGILMLAVFLGVLIQSSGNFVTCVDVPPGCLGAECRVQCSFL